MPFKGIIGAITEVRRRAGELCLEWRIPRFLHLLANSGNDYYESPRFSFSDGIWQLRVLPNSKGLVHLRLNRDVTNTSTVTLIFAVGLRGTDGEEKRREDVRKFMNCDWSGVPGFCTRRELSEQRHRLMPGDALTITCEIKAPGTTITAYSDSSTQTDSYLEVKKSSAKQDSSTQTVEEARKDKVPSEENQSSEKQESSIQTVEEARKHKVSSEENQSSEKQALEELQKSFESLLASKEECDVVLKVKDKEFQAHKVILRSRSAVFQAMFTHDMLEKQRGVVTLEDCDPDTFPDFLDHIYTGSLRMICSRNVFSLYLASDKYDLDTLKNECVEFLKRNLNVSCFCDTIALAIRHNERELTEFATEFFCSNSLDIVETVEWQNFSAENPTVGNELLIKLLSKHGNIFRGTC